MARIVLRVLLGALVAAALIGVYAEQWMGRITLHVAFVCNAVLLPLLAALLARRRGGDRATGAPLHLLFEDRRQTFLFLGVFALGVAARVAVLPSFPPQNGQLWEETQTGKVALESIQHGSLDPYFPATNLLAEIGFRALGVSMLSLRIPFVAAGIGSVALFFVAARFFLRGAPAALLAAALFASNAFLATCSRVALETFSALFTQCLAFAAVFYAAARRTPAGFALAGWAVGLLSLEYFGYKLLPPLLLAFLVCSLAEQPAAPFCNRLAARRRWDALREHLPHLLVFAIFAAAAIAPVVLSDPRRPQDFFLEGWKRQQFGIDAATSGAPPLARLELAAGRVASSASFVFFRGSHNDLLPISSGVLDLCTGIIGLAALAYCARFAARSAAKSFLMVTAVSIVVLAGLLVGNPSRYRLAPLVPVYLLAVGVLIDDALAAPQARTNPKRFLGFVVAGTALVAIVNLAGIGLAVRDRGVRREFHDLNLLLAKEIAALEAADPTGIIYLVSDRDFLGNGNDYDFLYDPRRVKVVVSPEAIGGDATRVVSHDEFATRLQQARGGELEDCRRWRAELGSNALLSCRMKRSDVNR